MTFTKDEWRELTRGLWPEHWTDDDFERAWMNYLDMLAKKRLH